MTIHRGTHEIGGSCVELHCGDSRIILDVGMPLVKPDGSEFDMREYAGLSGPELLENGVLPSVEGLYEWQEPSVAGILLSHAHMDHYGFIGHVHPQIPIYASEETFTLLKVSKRFIDSTPTIKKPVVFSWGQPFECGAFKVIPHLVDHSACGAYAFLVEAEGKRVLYSGDLRDHGKKSKTFSMLIKAVPKGIDAVLLEGTMLGREGAVARTEEELYEEAVQICRETKGPVLACQSGQNIDRLCVFFKAAKRTGRLFLIDPYVAHILDSLYAPPRINIPTVSRNESIMKVFYPSYLRQSDIALRYGPYKIEAEEVAAESKHVLMIVRQTMLGYLKKVHKNGNVLTGGMLLYSMWSGYKEKRGMKTFLEGIEEQGMKVRDLHTSGHANVEALQKLVARIDPKRTIPIHTFHKSDYERLFGPSVVTLEDGEELKL